MASSLNTVDLFASWINEPLSFFSTVCIVTMQILTEINFYGWKWFALRIRQRELCLTPDCWHDFLVDCLGLGQDCRRCFCIGYYFRSSAYKKISKTSSFYKTTDQSSNSWLINWRLLWILHVKLFRNWPMRSAWTLR